MVGPCDVIENITPVMDVPENALHFITGESEKNFSIALYSVGIKGGARWEFSDLATIFQVFHKVDNKWILKYPIS